MRTILTLHEDVAASLRSATRKMGLSYKELVNNALRCGLEQMMHPPQTKRYRTKPKAMGLRAGLSYDNVNELLAIVEGGSDDADFSKFADLHYRNPLLKQRRF